MDRLAVIKAAAEHTWRGYREHAWGRDEIKPVSGKSGDPFNGWGATLVDGLDTLWIMGMKTEFEEAVKYVETIDFTTSPRSDIPLFETTIRYLGGLIAAYEVSDAKYRALLDKAVELVRERKIRTDLAFWLQSSNQSLSGRASSADVEARLRAPIISETLC
jgi:mannosyl-oligosaccharide alpha-1,2-mannosidase